MSSKSYGLFCPISKACEVIEPRWTLSILAEMSSGVTRFNDIRRGIPGISPSLLSKRLKEMERQRLIERLVDKATGSVDYLPTDRAVELFPIMVALGEWAQRNIDAEEALVGDEDARTLMWYVRRRVDANQLPRSRTTLRFKFTDAAKDENSYWLVSRPGMEIELCISDPGFDVDLYIDTEMKLLAGILLGRCSLRGAISRDEFRLLGSPILCRTVVKWLKLSQFAHAPGTMRLEKRSRTK